MSLRLILGPSGSGKSRRLFETALQESEKDLRKRYLILVPEQFTMQTQQQLCALSPVGGILNLDILSFSRLAVRVFEETGVRRKTLLKETGKILLLRLIADRNASGLPLLAGAADRPGALGELKSILSEMDQYEITDAQIRDAAEQCTGRPALAEKLRQLAELRRQYRLFQETHGLQTAETIPEALCGKIPDSRMLKGSQVYLDGYTGFTPAQLDVLRSLLRRAARVTVTVTIDPDADFMGKAGEEELFALPKRTIQTLVRIAEETGTEIESPIVLGRDTPGRFAPGSALGYLERSIFRPGSGKPYACAGKGLRMEETPSEDGDGPDEPRKAEDPGILTDMQEHPIRILSCRNPMEEVMAAAAVIRQLTLAPPRTGTGTEQTDDAGSHCGNGAWNTEHPVRSAAPLRYREIAVVVGDFGTYSEAIRRVFTKARIPFFLDRSVPVTLNPVSEFVRAAFSILDANYSYESMAAFFRTGFVFDKRENADVLENYILAAGIRGHRAWTQPWTRPAEGFPEEALGELETLRVYFAERFEPFAEICRRSARRLSEYAGALWTMMDAFGVQQKLAAASEKREQSGERTEAEIYGQAASAAASVLDEAVSLLGDEKVKRTQFEQILEAGFSDMKIGVIPPGADEVAVGDLTRSRLTNVRAVLLLGMNDDFVPMRKKPGGILTDMEREYLGKRDFHLAPTAREDAAVQRFYLYLCLTKPSELLVLSSCRTGQDGSVMRPAPVLRQIMELFPDVRVSEGIPGGVSSGVYLPEEMLSALSSEIADSRGWSADERISRAPVLRELCSAASAVSPERTARLLRTLAPPDPPHLSARAAGLLYGDDLEGSVSRLETFAQCPFRQYAVYGLGLNERARYEVRPSDIGNLMHRALQLLAQKVDASPGCTWKSLSPEQCAGWADECLAEAALELSGGKFEDTARSAGQLLRLKRIFRHAAEVMRVQLAEGSFRPALFEVRFDSRTAHSAAPLVFENGSRMHLSGRIDRIDESSGEDGTVYVKVVDYKTGSTEFDLKQVYMGTQLQLPVYMDSALRLEQARHRGRSIVCAGILYFPVRDPVLDAGSAGKDAEQIRLERLKKVRPSGLVRNDPEVLERLSKDAERLPYIAPVSLTKSGDVSRTSSVADENQMRLLSDYTGWKMKETGERILSGEIAPFPLKENERTSTCTRCLMRPVCGFSENDPLMPYRKMESGTRDDIWNLMRKKLDSSSDR